MICSLQPNACTPDLTPVIKAHTDREQRERQTDRDRSSWLGGRWGKAVDVLYD